MGTRSSAASCLAVGRFFATANPWGVASSTGVSACTWTHRESNWDPTDLFNRALLVVLTPLLRRWNAASAGGVLGVALRLEHLPCTSVDNASCQRNSSLNPFVIPAAGQRNLLVGIDKVNCPDSGTGWRGSLVSICSTVRTEPKRTCRLMIAETVCDGPTKTVVIDQV